MFRILGVHEGVVVWCGQPVSEGSNKGLDMRFGRANQHSRSRMAVVFSRYVAEFETQMGIR